MPKRLFIAPTIHSYPVKTVNLGPQGQLYGSTEIGKPVKLAGPDTFVVCADGDKIEGIITSSEYASNGATRGGRSIGGITSDGYFNVKSAVKLAAGDYVVAAAQPAVGTRLADTLGDAIMVKKAADGTGPFAVRIVGLGSAGSGDPGTTCVAEFV